MATYVTGIPDFVADKQNIAECGSNTKNKKN